MIAVAPSSDAFPEYVDAGLAEYASDWHIWRSRATGLVGPIPGDWYATIRDNSIEGVPRTVVADSAPLLAQELRSHVFLVSHQ